jgi:hypothetical protein
VCALWALEVSRDPQALADAWEKLVVARESAARERALLAQALADARESAARERRESAERALAATRAARAARGAGEGGGPARRAVHMLPLDQRIALVMAELPEPAL